MGSSMGAKDSASTLVETISFAGPAQGDQGDSVSALADAIARAKDAPVTLEVRLGEVLLTIQQLQALQVGSVVALDRALDDLVDVLVNGQVIARGRLVAHEELYGVQISEIGSVD